MTTNKRLLLVAGLCSIALFACGSDPNKKADDAHDAELQSDRKQQQSEADQRGDSRVKAAEVQRENTEATAGGGSASKERTTADAKLTEARDIHRAKATERLEKLDARTFELKALVDKAGNKATTVSHESLKTVDIQHAMVTRDLDALPRASNDDWQQAKTNVDAQLDTLEGLIKKAANEVDKFKK